MRYLVHPRAHLEWGEQSLYFLFLGLRFSYDGDDLAEALSQAFEEHQVTAQVTYEVIGRFDLVVRIWLPPTRIGAFRATLEQKLDDLSLYTDVQINVTEIVRHWPWGSEENARGPIRPPDRFDDDPTMEKLRLLNRVAAPDPSEVADEDIASLVSDGLITGVTDAPENGVKLITLIAAGTDLSNHDLGRLERRLARELDDADPTLLSECSLYRSDSKELPFIIMCRVSHSGWENVNGAFFDRVRGALIGRARTQTYPVMRRSIVASADSLSTPPASATRTETLGVAELLASDESKTLEVKATAFGPLDPWLQGDGPILDSVALFEQTILKAVVAFLNAAGGTVVIGALEARRYRGFSKDTDDRLADFPVEGQYICLGLLDPFFVERGWDKYHLRIADLLDKRISDSPVNTGLVTVEKDTHRERDFCLVRVSEPDDEHHWFYALGTGTDNRQKFYVRRDARSVELQGAEADRYKRQALHSRGSRRSNGERRR